MGKVKYPSEVVSKEDVASHPYCLSQSAQEARLWSKREQVLLRTSGIVTLRPHQITISDERILHRSEEKIDSTGLGKQRPNCLVSEARPCIGNRGCSTSSQRPKGNSLDDRPFFGSRERPVPREPRQSLAPDNLNHQRASVHQRLPRHPPQAVT